MNNEFKGVWTAIVTPFTGEGDIDWPAYERLLQKQAEAKVKGVVVCGTTGESPTLTVQEKLSLMRKARAFLPETIRVMGGSGGNNTEQSVELSRLAQDAGCDSLLVVTPPYNKPSPAGLKAHFEAIAKSVSVPLCLYHVPGRTAQLLSADVLGALCGIKGVDAVKEASANLELFSKARQLSGKEYLSGDDMTYLPSLAVGGQGVISVLTNIFPEAFVAMTTAFWKRDFDKALALHDAMLGMMAAMFWEPNPGPIKAVLHMAGLCENALRLPLVPVTKETYQKLQSIYDETKRQLKSLAS